MPAESGAAGTLPCRVPNRLGPRALAATAALAVLLLVGGRAAAFTIEFSSGDFALSPTFSDVQTFDIAIEVAGPLAPGVYENPELVSVVYNVSGSLDDTPSGFDSFGLARTIGGAEFYLQGSSLVFEISATADLSDGLQASELVGGAETFVFDGREVGTGRYHPALFELFADGTGLLRNSNNMGGVNPFSMEVVDVQIGDEYVTALGFDPSTLTLVAPEPSPGVLVGIGLALFGAQRRSAT